MLRSRGGADRDQSMPEYPGKVKAKLHRPEKSRIAQAAAHIVPPNQTIILDSGTTTAETAKVSSAQG
jgi:DeoR family transcriptional regulator of aga operon